MTPKTPLLAALAAAALCGSARAAIIPELLKPDVKREVQRLEAASGEERAAAQRRLGEIDRIQRRFLAWRNKAEESPERARDDYAARRERDQKALESEFEEFRSVVPAAAVDSLVEDLETAPDDSWDDAVRRFVECYFDPTKCSETKRT